MDPRSVNEIRALFKDAPVAGLASLIAEFSSDERSGVLAIVASAQRSIQADRAERDRIRHMMSLQLHLHDSGMRVIAGVDEVGRGALAGPVTAAAVVLDPAGHIADLDDSKRLSPATREVVAQRVRETAIAYAVVHVGPDRVDALGIAAANTLAMRTAISRLACATDHVIADGLAVDLGVPATFVIGGDRQCACVAAASVIAKVDRDALMRELNDQHPGYDLDLNKGYGTAEHMDAIERMGASPVHRLSFAPCAQHRLF